MANTFITPTAVTREFLRVLHSNIPFISSIDKQHSNETTFGGVKRGQSINIRKPTKYSVRTGATANVQDHEETSSTLTVSTQKGVDVAFSSAEMTQSLDDFSSRVIAPAAARLAAQLESDALSMYKDVWNSVGTAGTVPQTALVYLQAQQKLDESLAMRNDRTVIINPETQAYTVDALKALFHSGPELGKQYKNGEMGQALGFKFKMGQLMPSLTTGTRTNTTPLVDYVAGYSTEGMSSIHVDGFASATATITEGDVFTIAGVYAVNEAGDSTGELQQFVVSADVTCASNEGDITFTPAIYTTGAKKNVDSFPANDAAVTFYSATASTAYPQNLAFEGGSNGAFTFATVDLDVPSGVDMAAREVMDGISIRCVRDYDVTNDLFVCRFDVLYGYVAQRPELAVRIWS